MSSPSPSIDHLIVLTQHILGKTIPKELAAEALKKRGNDPHKAIDFILNQFDIEERLSALTNPKPISPHPPTPSSLYPSISSSYHTATPPPNLSHPPSYATALHHPVINNTPSSSSSSSSFSWASRVASSNQSQSVSISPSPISSSNYNNNNSNSNNNNSNNSSSLPSSHSSSTGDDGEGEIEQGRVLRINRDKNEKLIGFIGRSYGQRDLFFHESRVIGPLPEKDDVVEYRVVHNEYSKHENKWNAVDVTVIKPATNNLKSRQIANTPNSTNDKDDISSTTPSRKFGVIASTDFLLINAVLPAGIEETKPVYIYSTDSIKTESRTVEEGDIVEFSERGPSSDPEAYDITRATYYESNKISTELFILHQTVKRDESKDLEFKSFAHASTGSTLVPTCEKYINSFLNSNGGTLLIGVDNDGKINGLTLDRKFRDKFRTGLDGCMQESTPPVDVDLYHLEILSLCQPFTVRRTIDGKSVSRTIYIEHSDRVIIRITVKARPHNIVAYTTSGRGGSDKVAWIRRDGSTRKMTPTEIAQRAKELERERLTEADVKTMIDNAIRERYPQNKIVESTTNNLRNNNNDASSSISSSSSTPIPPLLRQDSDEDRLIEMVSNYGFEKSLVSGCVKTVLNHPNNRNANDTTDPKRMQFIVSQILDLIINNPPSRSHSNNDIVSSSSSFSSSSSSLLSHSHPAEFLDPVTKELMTDPYLCSDSYNYNKTTIDFLFTSPDPRSPVTKQPMVKTALPNRSLQEQIQRYLQSLQQTPPPPIYSPPPPSLLPAAPIPSTIIHPRVPSPLRYPAMSDERKSEGKSDDSWVILNRVKDKDKDKEKEKDKRSSEKKLIQSKDKKDTEKLGVNENPFALLDIPKLSCPLCNQQFPATELVAHASDCQGEENQPIRQRMVDNERKDINNNNNNMNNNNMNTNNTNTNNNNNRRGDSASSVMDLMNPNTNTNTNTNMDEDKLPCEFCDDLVPLSKYSEHAIQCRTRQTSSQNPSR